MVDVRDLRAVVDAAEQAAAAGNHALAEQLLREAAILQEATLGPLHADLANTLNNLGVVCEIVGKTADAERSYRRAYAIATAVLEPNHPFVATSGNNLRAFCEARGTPFESPAPPPVAAAEPERPAPAAVPPRGERSSGTESTRSVAKKSWRPAAIVLGAGVLAIVVFIVARGWFSADGQEGSSPASVTPLPEPKPPAESAAPAPAPVPVPPPVAPGRVPDDTTVKSRVAAPASAPIVAEAEVCRNLSTGGDWRCDPASSPVDPGTLFFYTRLKSATDTTVQHRWYRGDRLHQAVALQIRANQSNGFRTFSRQTVTAQTVGEWRVELRDATGTLLHERRISVR